MITISKEDYLKAILEAEADGENVISATLAHWLNVSPPSVTMALRRLKKDGMVQIRADGRVQLTRAGQTIARRTVNRHHLIERMLTEMLGMEWYKVHEEAERIEHAVSADLEQKLAEKLGSGACPHGNDANPETRASRRKRGLKLLSEAKPRRAYKVASVYERDRKVLEFLEERSLRPGATLHVLALNYDRTVTLKTQSGKVSVGQPIAEKVWVRPLPGK